LLNRNAHIVHYFSAFVLLYKIVGMYGKLHSKNLYKNKAKY